MIDNILCHVGPWSISHYRFIANQISPNANISVLSGHPKYDRSGLFNRYFQIITQDPPSQVDPATPIELDIILRCRLLRTIDQIEALFHLRAMWTSMSIALDNIKPDLILTETIDYYVIDILHTLARQRNIAFVGLVPTFISGYFRISARGEYVLSRKVTPDEIQNVLDKLLRVKYKPDFIKNSDSRLWIYAIGRWLRNLIKIPYFWLKRLDSKERFNFHNWATLTVSRLWAHPIPMVNLGDRNWRRLLSKTNKPVIYIPLQMTPEATVDYWCEDSNAVNYEDYLIKLVKRLKQDFLLLFKEHPNVLGYRNPRVYKQLLQMESVVFAPTHTDSHELIDASDTVLVWTGSVGFEAAIRGKPVLTVCNPYYAHGNNFKKISLQTSVIEIKQFLQSFNSQATAETNHELLTHILSGALPGRYIIDGSWSATNPEHINYAKNIAVQIKKYLNFANIGNV